MILRTPKIQIVALMNFYIYVQNQLYTSYSSWNVNVMETFLIEAWKNTFLHNFGNFSQIFGKSDIKKSELRTSNLFLSLLSNLVLHLWHSFLQKFRKKKQISQFRELCIMSRWTDGRIDRLTQRQKWQKKISWHERIE